MSNLLAKAGFPLQVALSFAIWEMLESRNGEFLSIHRSGKVPKGRQCLEQVSNLSVAIEIRLLLPYDLVSRFHG